MIAAHIPTSRCTDTDRQTETGMEKHKDRESSRESGRVRWRGEERKKGGIQKSTFVDRRVSCMQLQSSKPRVTEHTNTDRQTGGQEDEGMKERERGGGGEGDRGYVILAIVLVVHVIIVHVPRDSAQTHTGKYDAGRY